MSEQLPTQRIEDPEKAHVMALAGDEERSRAAGRRDLARMAIEEDHPIQGGNDYDKSSVHDEAAEQLEAEAGAEYERENPKA